MHLLSGSLLIALALSHGLASVFGVTTVNLGSTTVKGIPLPSLGQEYFLGIPYAEAFVGSLRFEPPISKLRLPGETFNASAFDPACPQFGTTVPMGVVIS